MIHPSQRGDEVTDIFIAPKHRPVWIRNGYVRGGRAEKGYRQQWDEPKKDRAPLVAHIACSTYIGKGIPIKMTYSLLILHW